MNHDQYDDSYLRIILEEVKTIAVVGASANPSRPSNGVMRCVIRKGFEVYPGNPGHAGGGIHGRPVYARLPDVPVAMDMIDVFRAADQFGSVVDEVLALPQKPRVIWGQLTVRD